MTSRRAIYTTLSVLLACGTAFLCGCQKQVDLTPKFTRAIHPVDAADASIVSQENFDKIATGMSQDEVRAVFGTEQPKVSGFKPEEEFELVWQAGEKEIAVRFRGEKSIEKSQKGLAADE